MLATQYCVQMQKNIRIRKTRLIDLIKMEKQKTNPDQHKINIAHQQLPDINNYKITGSIIQSKKKLILEQEKPNKFFFDQKQKSKTIKQLQKNITTNEMKTITTDYKILKYCKAFLSNLYTKTKTNKKIQEELLKPMRPKITHQQNQK